MLGTDSAIACDALSQIYFLFFYFILKNLVILIPNRYCEIQLKSYVTVNYNPNRTLELDVTLPLGRTSVIMTSKETTLLMSCLVHESKHGGIP